MPSIVGPWGPPDAKIAIIGEAPGINEIREGRPFVGEAGQQLRRSTIDAGISLSECYLTNVIKERPIDNNIKLFIDLSRKYPQPTEAYKKYEQALYEELLLLEEVNVLVPVGNVPLYAITRKHGKKSGILKWRGSIIETSILGRTFKVIPTIHPAALLPGRGKYIWRYPVRNDFVRVLNESRYPEVRDLNNVMVIGPTFEQSMDYLQDLLDYQSIVMFDIETYNLEISCISFSKQSHEGICIPFIEESHNYFTIEQEMLLWKKIGELLQDESILKIAQNTAFDTSTIFEKYGIVSRPLGDTMVQHSILYPELPRGLDFMTSIYTKQPYYKDIGQRIFSEGSDK